MNSKVKERIYLLVMLFCLLICVVLIISVLLGKPLATINSNVYTPAMRAVMHNAGEVSTAGGTVLDDAMLSLSIVKYLPEALAVTDVSAKVYSDAKMSVVISITKDACREYFDSIGFERDIQHTVAMGMLPDMLDINVLLQFGKSENGGMEVSVLNVFIGEQEADSDFLPARMYEDINQSIRQVIAAQGDNINYIMFEEGAIVLQE